MTEIASFDSIADMIPFMLDGTYNPGQLQIVREILTGTADFDTANFSDVAANYSIVTGDDGVTTVTHLVPPAGGLTSDGVDRLVNIERLQFADQSITLAGVNNDPVGTLTILDAATNTPDDTPTEGQLLRASIAGVTDADNPGDGSITGPVAYHWQVEARPGTGIFEDIRLSVRGNEPARAEGATLLVTPDLAGLVIRVRAVYQDANGVLEQVFSPATAAVEDIVVPPPTPVPATPDGSTVPTDGLRLIASDLAFILDQIKIAEQDAAGADLLDLIPNSRVAFGLRTIDGSFNNLVNIGNDRSDRVRRLRQPVPAAARPVLPQRPGRRRDRSWPASGTGGHQHRLRPERRRCRCRSAHHFEPDRRPDQQEPGGGGGGRVSRRGWRLGHP